MAKAAPETKIELKNINLVPQYLKEENVRGNMECPYKIVVVIRKDLRNVLSVATGFGFHQQIIQNNYPKLCSGGSPNNQVADYYGARVGLIKVPKKQYALVINGFSATYETIPEQMGLLICRKLSQVLQARKKLPKERKAWKGIEWQWIGTQLPESYQLQLEALS